MQNTRQALDNFIARLLWVTPQETNTEQEGNGERVFSFALLFSGVRCIFMYVVLPFILPVIGIAGDFGIWLDIAINLVAIGAIFYSLRRFWIVDYARKWQYLPVALVALVLLVSFIGLDIYTLL